jgi:hypothetical protein
VIVTDEDLDRTRRTRGTEPTEWRRRERREPIIPFTTTVLHPRTLDVVVVRDDESDYVGGPAGGVEASVITRTLKLTWPSVAALLRVHAA